LRGVIRVFSSNCKNDFGGVTEFLKSVLAIFGGITDRIKVYHFYLGSLFADFIHKCRNVVDGLGGLRDNADEFHLWNGRDVIGMKNDPGLLEIFLKTTDFDVFFLSNDDRLKALGDNLGELGVCDFDERAGRVRDLISGIGPTLAVTISGTVWACFEGKSGAVFIHEHIGKYHDWCCVCRSDASRDRN
jgi:hypothetical protein